jgi:hypothetical protein
MAFPAPTAASVTPDLTQNIGQTRPKGPIGHPDHTHFIGQTPDMPARRTKRACTQHPGRRRLDPLRVQRSLPLRPLRTKIP